MSTLLICGWVLIFLGIWITWQAGGDLGRTRAQNRIMGNPKWEDTGVVWGIVVIGMTMAIVGGVLVEYYG